MTQPKYPTQAELQEVFEYVDGELWRKEYVSKDGRTLPRKLVKFVLNNGGSYCRVIFKRQKVLYHAVVKILVDGDPKPGEIIDHVEGDILDNNPKNLVWKTQRENSQNRYIHREGKLPGVWWWGARKTFMVRARFEGKKQHLGYFATQLEAFDAYIHFHQEHNLPFQHLLKLRAEYIERNAA